MRDRNGLPNQAVEMRCGSNALGRAAGAIDWGGTKSNCVGGTILCIPVNSTHGTTITLDTSIDFRDRNMLTQAYFSANAHTLPGDTAGEMYLNQQALNQALNVDYWINCNFTTALGWDGSTAPNGTNHYNYTKTVKNSDLTISNDLILYADSTTGALKFKNASVGTDVTAILWLLISEQTGKRSSVP